MARGPQKVCASRPLRRPLVNSLRCLKCQEDVAPDARQWHFTRYMARVDVRVALCAPCDTARANGCAICQRTALASIPLCVDCLIERETVLTP